ncbi:hypothetical protein OG250_40870 [Streptomyces sp. NBC_00487]|nr:MULTISPECIES: hypothetical protein [unclassified Streptomyces]
MADAVKDGDGPTSPRRSSPAATDEKPKPRYTAGPPASRVTTARRLVPAGTFDQRIRKNNRLPG